MKYLLIILILAISFKASAQTPPKSELVVVTGSTQVAKPLILIAKQPTAMGAFILEPEKIKSIDVVKGKKATTRYGDKAKEGAIIIELKRPVTLSRLPQVLAHFEVTAEKQELKVAIDGKIVQQPDMLLVEIASVKNLEVTTAENFFVEGGQEQVLNLITK